MEAQPEIKLTRKTWFRWSCRFIFLVMLILLVPAVQNTRAIVKLKSLDEVDFHSEPGVLLESLPLSWKSWLYTTFGKDQLYLLESTTQFDCNTKKDLTDTELAFLCDFRNLKSLYLNSREISDAGLVHLKRLRKLSWLNLDKTHIRNTGLIHLQELPNLKILILRGTPLNDAGLIHLEGLKKLSRLWLNDTHVTPAGIAQLQAALPDCEIQYSAAVITSETE